MFLNLIFSEQDPRNDFRIYEQNGKAGKVFLSNFTSRCVFFPLIRLASCFNAFVLHVIPHFSITMELLVAQKENFEHMHCFWHFCSVKTCKSILLFIFGNEFTHQSEQRFFSSGLAHFFLNPTSSSYTTRNNVAYLCQRKGWFFFWVRDGPDLWRGKLYFKGILF